ncbi:MAG: hypothetical protein R3C19_09900 [Planctomycetaceae bacterium]
MFLRLQLSRQLSRLRSSLFRRPKRAGRRRLSVLKLEDRRLPDASFAVVGGALVLNGFDAGDTLTIETTAPDQNQFTLTNGIWDASDDDSGDLFTLSAGGQVLTVNASPDVVNRVAVHSGAGDLAGVNDGDAGVQMRLLGIRGGGDVVLDNPANNFQIISAEAESLVLTDSDDIALNGITVSDSLSISAGGSINDVAGTVLDVGGNASFRGTDIVLGNNAADTTNFGSLSFSASGDVVISEDSGTQISTSDDITMVRRGKSDADVYRRAGCDQCRDHRR